MTVACQTPLFMGFSRQEYWSGLPFPPPGHLPNSDKEITSAVSPAVAGRDSLPLRLGNTCHCLIRSISSTPQGASVVRNSPASIGDPRDAGFIPGSGRSPGRGNGNPLQYSCLGNPILRPWGPQKSSLLNTHTPQTPGTGRLQSQSCYTLVLGQWPRTS